MTFLGIDLHGDCFTCCFLNEAGFMRKESFSLEAEGLAKFLPTLNRGTHILIEENDNKVYAFVELFQQRVAEVIIVNARKLKLISLTDRENDSVETHKLSRLLKAKNLSDKEQIHPVLVPPTLLKDLRMLFFSYTLNNKKFSSTKSGASLGKHYTHITAPAM